MQNDEIRISKKLCEFQAEERFKPSGYRIKMPSGSKYEGYHFMCSDWYATSNANYVSISEGSEYYEFVLIKSEREPGKRYARPKLTFAELKAAFAEHSRQFYSDNLPQALAYVKTYRNNGRFNADDVVDESFCVGGYSEKWFYVTDTDKRRLGTKGVTLLCELSPEEVAPMKERIARYKALQYEIRACDDLSNNVKNDRRILSLVSGSMRDFLYDCKKYVPALASAIDSKADEIQQIIDNYAVGLKQEYDALDAVFSNLLKQAV